jgi:hypothetical protein
MNISYINTSGQPASLITGCTTSGCHTSAGFTIDYIGSSSTLTGGLGSHTAVELHLDSLRQLLADRGWLNTETDLVNASNSNPLRIVPGVKAGALFNYFFIEHDMSEGAHNTRYTLELLISSIEELKKP